MDRLPTFRKGELSMTASVQTKKDRPNYFIVLAWKDVETDKNKTKWVGTNIPVKGNNKRLAEKRRVEVLAEYESQKIDLGKDVLFDAFIEKWLEDMKHSVEATTYDTYTLIVKRRIIPFFKPLRLCVKDIAPAHIQQFVKQCLQTVSANTVHRYLANLSKCLDSAVKQNIIHFNPVKRIDPPKKTKYTGAKFYNEQQINELIERSKGDALESIILLTVFYGLRRSEVNGLQWSAVDFINNTITIKHTVVPGNKTLHKKDSAKNDSSNATLPMPSMIKEQLLKWKKQQEDNKRLQPNDYIESEYICTQANGALMRPDFISQHFQILLKNIGLPRIRFHDLRHSSASYLLYLGFSMKEIQTWLRHKDIQTTMNIYTHMDMTGKRGIADSLNERLQLKDVEYERLAFETDMCGSEREDTEKRTEF